MRYTRHVLYAAGAVFSGLSYTAKQEHVKIL